MSKYIFDPNVVTMKSTVEDLRGDFERIKHETLHSITSVPAYERYYSGVGVILNWASIFIDALNVEELEVLLNDIEEFSNNIGPSRTFSEMMFRQKMISVRARMSPVYEEAGPPIFDMYGNLAETFAVFKIGSERPSNYTTMFWHYAHGELELLAGFDNMYFHTQDISAVSKIIGGGEHDIRVYVEAQNKVYDCVIFSWKLDNNQIKGLVVKKGDTESYNDAKSKYNSRAETI